jgi:AbrB family looped-hinge helix DNA binding protein
MVYFVPMAEVVSVDRAGRVVIPKAIREAAGIGAEAKLLVAVAEKGRVVFQKLDVDSIASRLEKELSGKDVDAIVRKVREEIRGRIRKAYPDLSS